MVASGLGSSLYYGLAVVWPSMVSLVYVTGDTVNDSLVSSLVGAGWLLGEITSGFMAAALRHIKIQSNLAMATAGTLLACVATCTVDTRTRSCYLVAFGTFFAGWVEGLMLTLTTLTLAKQDELGTGCGFGGSIRFSITTIVTAIYNAILNARLANTILAEISSAAEQAGLPRNLIPDVTSALASGQNLTSIDGVSQSMELILHQGYQTANIDAYRTVFYWPIPSPPLWGAESKRAQRSLLQKKLRRHLSEYDNIFLSIDKYLC